MSKDAKTLIDEQAQRPELDPFFDRIDPLKREAQLAMLRKYREERASWGPGRSKTEEDT